MSFTVMMGSSAPATTEAVFGETNDYKSFSLNLDEATPADQKVCTDFLALVGAHATVNILNSTHDFQDCNYVIAGAVETDIIDVDYSTLTAAKKGKINAFANLLKSLAQ